jgi:hypothetical protein
MAGFAGVVHGRQSAASAKNDCHSKCNNQWGLHGETHYDPAPEPSVNRAPDERAVNIGAGLWSQSLKLLDLLRPHYDCGLFSKPGSLPMLMAMRRASSRVNRLAAARRPGSS